MSVVLSKSVLVVEIDFFFFFQAEDGIRDYKVTGVQTCALPICLLQAISEHWETADRSVHRWTCRQRQGKSGRRRHRGPRPDVLPRTCRSEEHTSELQSPCNLVCRLLLEKKKNT